MFFWSINIAELFPVENGGLIYYKTVRRARNIIKGPIFYDSFLDFPYLQFQFLWLGRSRFIQGCIIFCRIENSSYYRYEIAFQNKQNITPHLFFLFLIFSQYICTFAFFPSFYLFPFPFLSFQMTKNFPLPLRIRMQHTLETLGYIYGN